jgi:hypothetical protein
LHPKASGTKFGMVHTDRGRVAGADDDYDYDYETGVLYVIRLNSHRSWAVEPVASRALAR